MYFIDRKKIEQRLDYIENLVKMFRNIKNTEDGMEKLALERIAHMLLEAVLEVGKNMIDGFIMRDPGSYDDIIDILSDEKVITEKEAEQFKELIPYRKDLVVYFTDVNHTKMYEDFKKNLAAFDHFPEAVRNYLEHELGPVSAFGK